MNELISVIIPTFNRAKVLERAIISVVNQTYQNIELIIVDDGSTDETSEICSRFDLTYIYQENKGVSAARNLAAKEARGEWLAFLDSDDCWHPRKLESQLSYSRHNPSYRLIHCDEIWIRGGVRVNPHKKHRKGGGDQFIPSLGLCLISPSAVLLKKELFNQHNGFLESYPVCEDYDLWLKITSVEEVGYIEEALLDKYGGHEDQLSRKFFAMDYYRIKSLFWILNNRKLTNDKKNALLKVLSKKCTILIKGYKKHNNLKNLNEIQSIAHEIDDVLQV